MKMEGPGAGWMWLKHNEYWCFVQSPTFVPNGVPNLLQSAPGGILGALWGSFGGHLGGLGRLLGILFVDIASGSFFTRFGGTPDPLESGVGGLSEVPLGLW